MASPFTESQEPISCKIAAVSSVKEPSALGEIIDRYQPKILYFDWWIQHEGYKPGLRQIAAYYYNRGLEWGFPTAICYKHDAMAFGSAIVDVERGKFADTKPYHWQTDTSITRNSWCYTTSDSGR